jgi:hypothetical protein
MSRWIPLLLPVASVAIAPALPPEGKPMLSARVEVAKARFAEGEPIEIRLTVENPGTQPVELAVDYPSFASIAEDEPGFVFSTRGTGLSLRPEEEDGLSLGKRVPLVAVPPHGSWSVSVFLQRFLDSPRSGSYRLPYSLRLTGAARPDAATPLLAAVKGELSFAVDPAKLGELDSALLAFARRLEGSDFWGRRAAVEALSVVRDERVIPHLVKMLKLGFKDEAFEALARFSGNDQARVVVIGLLESDDPAAVVKALDLLKGWKYALEPGTIKVLMKHADPRVGAAVRRYLDAADDPAKD